MQKEPEIGEHKDLGPQRRGGAFCYADESGNSGKKIFHDPPWYLQGAIISIGDIEQLVTPLIESYCEKWNVGRLHGYELGERRVCEVVCEAVDLLSFNSTWEFLIFGVEKRYMAPTKFVDAMFDCYENPHIPILWYEVELFRHALCLIIDDMMRPGEDKGFWSAYLSNDNPGLLRVCSTLRKRSEHIQDARLKEVVAGGLDFVMDHIETFSFTASRGKKAKKPNSPNVAAFSGLLYMA